jgi:hypothetical protein
MKPEPYATRCQIRTDLVLGPFTDLVLGTIGERLKILK